MEDDVAKVGDGEADHEGGDADAKPHLQQKIAARCSLAKWN